METKGKKESLRLMISNGPPELDWLYSFARRKFISVTFSSIDGGKRELSVCVDGLKEMLSGEEVIWAIWGHFSADGKNEWVAHPAKELNLYLWGGFSGEYDKRTRLGHINTENYVSAGELAQRIRQEEEQESEEKRKIWKMAGDLVREQLERIERAAIFAYTEKSLTDLWREIYCELEEEVQQAGLRRNLHSDSGEYKSLNDFVIFSLRTGLEALRQKHPEKILRTEV